MEPTPDTSGYMILGYALTFVILAIYLASMYIRKTNLTRDLETLESLKIETKEK